MLNLLPFSDPILVYVLYLLHIHLNSDLNESPSRPKSGHVAVAKHDYRLEYQCPPPAAKRERDEEPQFTPSESVPGHLSSQTTDAGVSIGLARIHNRV